MSLLSNVSVFVLEAWKPFYAGFLIESLFSVLFSPLDTRHSHSFYDSSTCSCLGFSHSALCWQASQTLLLTALWSVTPAAKRRSVLIALHRKMNKIHWVDGRWNCFMLSCKSDLLDSLEKLISLSGGGVWPRSTSQASFVFNYSIAKIDAVFVCSFVFSFYALLTKMSLRALLPLKVDVYLF